MDDCDISFLDCEKLNGRVPKLFDVRMPKTMDLTQVMSETEKCVSIYIYQTGHQFKFLFFFE